MAKLSVIKGDITLQEVDAIVNAANTSLLGGGGVDGAIHLAAGPGLLDACRKLNGCATGEAKITEGFRLPAEYVIHTVGPIWHGGNNQEGQFLSNAYYNSLVLAVRYNVHTIAFPNISTGVYGFPKDKAAKIAVETVQRFNGEHPGKLEEVRFVCFDEENYNLYDALLK
ncbi:O-acetyl-ADP-ribose deacetylase [Polluticoccus soli]|uniref:O-acetyl-ADP-ribose deacetylase n=1 Tax=Polluticoccus soli TaxID=3034150 RepID=UPI0023E19EDD|nr:O-acetyl-ADP-ribose deacetylase [Flavipsychrobacter sp. JY13-12]